VPSTIKKKEERGRGQNEKERRLASQAPQLSLTLSARASRWWEGGTAFTGRHRGEAAESNIPCAIRRRLVSILESTNYSEKI